jgi:CRP/FNR family transcriptional regulator
VGGAVKMTHTGDSGRESIVGLAFAADWLGTATVVADRPSPFRAITCSETLLSSHPAAAFRHLLRTDAQLSADIHRAHAADLCRQATRIGQLCSLDSRRRLRAALYRFAVSEEPPLAGGRSLRINLPLYRWELAQFIGVTAEHLNRLFNDIQNEGLIRREKGWIVVQDLEQLRRATEAHR